MATISTRIEEDGAKLVLGHLANGLSSVLQPEYTLPVDHGYLAFFGVDARAITNGKMSAWRARYEEHGR